MKGYYGRKKEMNRLRDIANYKFKAIFISLKIMAIYISIII